MKEDVLVRELENYQGKKITTKFLVLESNKRIKRDGSPYIELLLSDSTGRVAGVLFEGVENYKNILRRGKVVKITGTVGKYSGEPQIKLFKVESVKGATPEEFLEHTPKDIEKMAEEFKSIIDREIFDPHIKELLKRVFIKDDEFFERFKLAPAAKKFHHPYVGGLLEHTLSVIGLAMKVCDHYPEVQRDLLIGGAFLHDIGKVDEYVYTPLIDKTDQGRLLGHLVIGYKRVEKVIEGMNDFFGGIPQEISMQILHMILSHHGRLDFGSPVIPQTLEAQILHYIDDMDAKVWMFGQARQIGTQGGGHWSRFHYGLDRYVFLGEENEESSPNESEKRKGSQFGLFGEETP